MIKLEVKQTQVASVPVPAPAETAAGPGRRDLRPLVFQVFVAGPNAAFVLAPEAEWVAAVEKETGLAQHLSGGAPFATAGRQVHVTATTTFPGGRVLYQCVAIAGMS